MTTDQQTLKAQLFAAKAQSYMVCFHAQCSRSAHCLRSQVGKYVPSTRQIIQCVNPAFVDSQQQTCPFYQKAEPIEIHRGMLHFYDSIPEREARHIRKQLVERLGNSTYYRLRNGTTAIDNSTRQLIERICRTTGWQGEITFDHTETAYDW